MKHIIWVRYILMAICVVVILMGWILRDDVDLMLNWMYVMLGIGVGSMLLMTVFSLAQDPKAAVQSLIGLAVILVLLGVTYSMSSGEAITTPTGYFDNEFELKIADTGLYAMYVLLAGAILAILAGEIRNAFK